MLQIVAESIPKYCISIVKMMPEMPDYEKQSSRTIRCAFSRNMMFSYNVTYLVDLDGKVDESLFITFAP